MDRKQIRANQDKFLALQLKNCGYTKGKAIKEGLRVDARIPVLISDWIKHIYPEHANTVNELLSWMKENV